VKLVLCQNYILFIAKGSFDLNNEKVSKIAEDMLKLTEYGSIYRSKHIKNAMCSNIKYELSPRQFSILIALTFVKKNTISELAEFMNISKSTLSIIMGKLIKKNYVQKVYPNEFEDKRKVYFYASEVGKEILERCEKENVVEFKYVYKTMTQQQKDNMKIGIEKLKQVAQVNIFKTVDAMYIKEDDLDEIEKMTKSIATFLFSFFEIIQEIIKDEFNINGKYNKNGITQKQYHILVCIKNFGLDTITKLEKFLNSSSSTLSISISRLVKEGYLYKVPPSKEEDGRIIYIKLTKKGLDILEEKKIKMKEVFVMYINSLQEEKQVIFSEALNYLLKALEVD